MKTVTGYDNDRLIRKLLKNGLFLLDSFRQKEVIMFLSDLVDEFLFDCKVRGALSELTVNNYRKQLKKVSSLSGNCPWRYCIRANETRSYKTVYQFPARMQPKACVYK